MPKFRVSRQFKVAIKLDERRSYKIAQAAGLDPAVLSKILCGIVEVKPGDRRVIAVGRVMGIPVDECFEEVRPDAG
jgi:dUTPase